MWRRCQSFGYEEVEYRFDWEAAYPEPHTPDTSNRIGIRRYRWAPPVARLASRVVGRESALPRRVTPDAGRTTDLAAVLILMPGFTGGVNDFHYFAPAIVAGC